MKRFICIFLAALSVACMAGCARTPEGGEQLRAVYNTVRAAEATVNGALGIIEWQITESEESLEEMENGTEEYDYDEQAVLEENQQKAAELASYIQGVESYGAAVNALQKTGVEQVDTTIEAAQVYFDKLHTALNDLMSIFTFYFDYQEASSPIYEFDTESDADELSYIDTLWSAMDLACTNLRAVECPAYMSQTNDLYITQIENYKTVLESLYKAAYLGDTLSFYSAENMSLRIEILLDKYGLRLTEDFNMQYQKVKDRLNGSIGKLADELRENCRTLLDAMGEEVA